MNHLKIFSKNGHLIKYSFLSPTFFTTVNSTQSVFSFSSSNSHLSLSSLSLSILEVSRKNKIKQNKLTKMCHAKEVKEVTTTFLN